MITAIVAGKAAPGATTSAWALSLTWPKPLLAIDADPAGGDMAAGLLAGRLDVDRGLLSWLATTRRAPARDAAAVVAEHCTTLPEAPGLWFLAGVQNPTQAASLGPGAWERLAEALAHVGPVSARDVLLDAGRLGEGSCWPVLRAANRVLLVAGRSLRSVHAATNAAALLREGLGDLDLVSMLVTGAGPYGADAITDQIGVKLAGELPDDRDTAMVLSDGARAGLAALRRRRLLRSARTVAARLAEPAMPVVPVIATRRSIASAAAQLLSHPR